MPRPDSGPWRRAKRCPAGELLSVDDTRVMWRRRDRLVVLPLDVSDVVREGIIGERAAVFTSATLQIGGRSAPWPRVWACGQARWIGEDVGPVRLPDAGASCSFPTAWRLRPGLAHPQALGIATDLVQAAGGRALVLMASWNGVAAMAQALELTAPGRLLVQKRGEPTAHDPAVR